MNTGEWCKRTIKPGGKAAYCCLPPAPSFLLLSEAGTHQSTIKTIEKTLPDCPAVAGKDWKCQKTQPLGLPYPGLLVENGKFGSAHTILNWEGWGRTWEQCWRYFGTSADFLTAVACPAGLCHEVRISTVDFCFVMQKLFASCHWWLLQDKSILLQSFVLNKFSKIHVDWKASHKANVFGQGFVLNKQIHAHRNKAFLCYLNIKKAILGSIKLQLKTKWKCKEWTLHTVDYTAMRFALAKIFLRHHQKVIHVDKPWNVCTRRKGTKQECFNAVPHRSCFFLQSCITVTVV